MSGSFIGMENIFLDPGATLSFSNADAANAFTYTSDVSSPAASWRATATFSQAIETPTHIGIVVIGAPVRCTFEWLASNGQNIGTSPYVTFPIGVTFQKITTAFPDYTLDPSNYDVYGLRLYLQNDAGRRLVEMWVGTPLELPHQFENTGAPAGLTRWNVESPTSEAGTMGGIISRPRPGILKTSMRGVPNSWIDSNWHAVRRWMARRSFWYALNDADTNQVAWCWTGSGKSPPPVNMSQTGISTISIDALTFPDYSE